ncbi:mitochondrial matrix iron-sulfur protein [Oleoguttula sp. CCFEE 5521]
MCKVKYLQQQCHLHKPRHTPGYLAFDLPFSIKVWRPFIGAMAQICTRRLALASTRSSTPAFLHFRPRSGIHPLRTAEPALLRQSLTPRAFLEQCHSFSSTPSTLHGHLTPPKAGEERHVTFVDKDSERHTLVVADGDNLLDVAQANDLEMEEGEELYDKMEEPSDDENDMLDLAFGLTETSRLGCQVTMSKALDGLVVKLPTMTRNMQASDFAEKK